MAWLGDWEGDWLTSLSLELLKLLKLLALHEFEVTLDGKFASITSISYLGLGLTGCCGLWAGQIDRC